MQNNHTIGSACTFIMGLETRSYLNRGISFCLGYNENYHMKDNLTDSYEVCLELVKQKIFQRRRINQSLCDKNGE
jgi:hypothetical protein